MTNTQQNQDSLEQAINKLESHLKYGKIKGLVLSLIVLLIFAAILFIGKSCNTTPKSTDYKHPFDSLKRQQSIDRKQFAYQRAEWEKEVTLSETRERQQQAQIIALHERSKLQSVQYTKLLSSVKKTAPIECQDYIDSIDVECGRLVNAKDDVIAASISRGDSLQMDLIKAKDFIKVQNDYIEKDSIRDSVKDGLIEGMIKDNKEIERKAKRERNGKRAAIGVGVAMFLIWLGVQVGG